jgi:hypothetical protein
MDGCELVLSDRKTDCNHGRRRSPSGTSASGLDRAAASETCALLLVPRSSSNATWLRLEPVADPPGEAGPIGAPTRVGIRLAQCGDAGEDEYKHRRKRRHACDWAVKDEHRKDHDYRVQSESDAYTVTDQTHAGDSTRA